MSNKHTKICGLFDDAGYSKTFTKKHADKINDGSKVASIIRVALQSLYWGQTTLNVTQERSYNDTELLVEIDPHISKEILNRLTTALKNYNPELGAKTCYICMETPNKHTIRIRTKDTKGLTEAMEAFAESNKAEINHRMRLLGDTHNQNININTLN